jgi:anti-anti-sigma factor
MAPFTIEQERGPHACVVHLSGDVDVSVVPELRESLDIAITAGCEAVVLDLAEVDYADSSALGLLVWLDHRLRPAHGRLMLAGANRDVTRILELSGLVNIAASIGMSANVSAALEGLELPDLPTETLWIEEIRMSPDVGELGRTREQVCSIVQPLQFADSTMFDIKVALGEALANAVRHGSPSNHDGEILVRVIAGTDRVAIEVEDHGPGFDGIHSSTDDVYAPGGRGVLFMRALMDRVEFEPTDEGGTRVRLVKHRTQGVGTD